jgi:non-ribosomal peptide synthetase component E (peptide arylation enzyme)
MVCAGNEIKIFDPVVIDNKAIGEIGYRGPGLFIEYFKNPARTDETRDDEGWFHTGDLGWVDDQGYLRITGRKKDVINRGGTKIFPGEIEGLLKFHPKIRDVSIIAMPDKVMGERSCACVILHPGTASITLEELESFLKDQGVTPYKWPEQLVTIDEFTMTPTGKVQKDDLRKKVQALIAESQKA